jgi:hypothetical protein
VDVDVDVDADVDADVDNEVGNIGNIDSNLLMRLKAKKAEISVQNGLQNGSDLRICDQSTQKAEFLTYL